jgi:hypothetical protein
MIYVVVAVGLAVLVGIHELVVWLAKRTIRRPWAVLLGPVTGYLVLVGFALVLFVGYGLGSGALEYVVDEALPGYDAVGKLEPGDRILEADHVAVSPTGATLVSRVEAAGGKPVVLTIERSGQRRDITVQPKQSQLADRTVWLLGIKNRVNEVRVHDTGAAVKAAALYPIHQTRNVAVAIREIIAGRQEAEIGGPVRILEEFKRRPAGLRAAFELLLLFAFYAWLALCVLDLVRLVVLARQPPARSSAS